MSPRGESFTHVWYPGFYIQSSLFAASAQETALDCLAVMARGACVPGPRRTVAITETVLGRTLHTEQTEVYPHPSLSVK